jgi:hypothetical protein
MVFSIGSREGTGSVEVLVFLLGVEHLFVLEAPVNLADPASADPPM